MRFSINGGTHVEHRGDNSTTSDQDIRISCGGVFFYQNFYRLQTSKRNETIARGGYDKQRTRGKVMSYSSRGIGNKKQHKHNKVHLNGHIPSISKVFGFAGRQTQRKSGQYISADYSFVPTSEIIKKPILDTSKMARDWANGKIKTEMSEEL